MKRRSIPILIALLTLVLCLGFTACRGDDPTTDTTEGATVAPDTPGESGEAPTDESAVGETEAPTEPETAAPTEEPTAAPTEPVTEAPTATPTEEPTEPAKSGCGSAVTFGLAAILVAAAVMLIRKKD